MLETRPRNETVGTAASQENAAPGAFQGARRGRYLYGKQIMLSFRPRSSICGSAAFHALFLLNLCGIALPAQAADASFAVTRNAHETYSENVCAEEFGQGYRVADWRDIEAQYRKTGSLDRLFSQTGLKQGGAVQVTLNGEQGWRNDRKRIFFIERHDGRKPDYFLAHAEINQHQLSLGSWTGARPVLCVQGAQPKVRPKIQEFRKPMVEVPFGLTRRSYAKASEYDTISDKVCVDEFGPGHLIADWQDIDAYFRKTGSLEAFFTHTGVEEAYVTREGKPFMNSATGVRFVLVTKENRQLGVLATLSGKRDSASLKLTSWPKDMDRKGYGGPVHVLCTIPSHSMRAAMNRAPVAVSPKLRTVTPEMERQARARASGCASIMNEDMRNFCISMSSSVGASCGGIKNADLRNVCMDKCDGVKNTDMRNVCIGIGKSIAADCGKVRDKELRTSCGEIRSHRQYESEGEERGGWFFW
jgi:hypothetical protein